MPVANNSLNQKMNKLWMNLNFQQESAGLWDLVKINQWYIIPGHGHLWLLKCKIKWSKDLKVTIEWHLHCPTVRTAAHSSGRIQWWKCCHSSGILLELVWILHGQSLSAIQAGAVTRTFKEIKAVWIRILISGWASFVWHHTLPFSEHHAFLSWNSAFLPYKWPDGPYLLHWNCTHSKDAPCLGYTHISRFS